MIRPRKRGKPNVPNLYEDGGYYSWRHPLTGKTYGLGRDRADAIHQAVEANLHVADLLAKPRLLDRLTDDHERTVAAWVDRFEADIVPERTYAASSIRHLKAFGRMVKKAHGELHVERWTPRHVDELVRGYARAGKRYTALQLRSYLRDLCGKAVNAGWLTLNIAAEIDAPSVRPKRARLTLEQFLEVHKAAASMPAWVQRSMELALVTAQRREDLAVVEFTKRKDSTAWVELPWLRVIQQKTDTRVAIPLSLRLQVVNWSVGDVAARCRDNVLSRHLLHHSLRTGSVRPGDTVGLQSITRAFREALRVAGVKWEDGRTPPTFHEIRSLSERLYREQGVDTQALLGHKSAKMTDAYNDPRAPRWVEVGVP